jgi:hypothetical protein
VPASSHPAHDAREPKRTGSTARAEPPRDQSPPNLNEPREADGGQQRRHEVQPQAEDVVRRVDSQQLFDLESPAATLA